MSDLEAMKAQRDHWSKRMHEGTLSASEVTAYLKLRTEIALLELQVTSNAKPTHNLPSFEDEEGDSIPFPVSKAR